jgi:hypothetical protein
VMRCARRSTCGCSRRWPRPSTPRCCTRSPTRSSCSVVAWALYRTAVVSQGLNELT